MDDRLPILSEHGYTFKPGDWVGALDPAEEECATCDERRKGCSFCCGRKRPGWPRRLWQAVRRG